MKKFNKFEADLICKGLDLAKEEWIEEIKNVMAKGKRSMFTLQFPNMYVKELKDKVLTWVTKK